MSNTYLEDIDFSAPASDISCGAHIAYTFAEQGGTASGFNTPLMFKNNAADAELSFEKLETLKSLGEDITELRKSYVSQIMDSLQSAVNDKYSDGWSWVSVVDADFDNNLVVFVTINTLPCRLKIFARYFPNTRDFFHPLLCFLDWNCNLNAIFPWL